MIAKAASRGAATIVNAIAIGKGAAFGITLETDAEVDLEAAGDALVVDCMPDGRRLVEGCVRSVAKKSGAEGVSGNVRVRSDIPASRGLKSSSAASNAVALATARALGSKMTNAELVLAGIEESIKAGVTVTGAFDDASACFMGGVVVTNNRTFTVLRRDVLDPDLHVIIHVPERATTKESVKGLDFSPIEKEVEKAFELAMRGEYLKAIELNSRAYGKVLDFPEDAVEEAKRRGALAAGVSGTGPATVALCARGEASDVRKAFHRLGGEVLSAHVNDVSAEEVVPRLL